MIPTPIGMALCSTLDALQMKLGKNDHLVGQSLFNITSVLLLQEPDSATLSEVEALLMEAHGICASEFPD